MLVARLFLVEFGASSLLLILCLGRQILLHEMARRRRGLQWIGSVEAVILLAATLAVATRYLLLIIHERTSPTLPSVDIGWMMLFACGCVVYLAGKLIRVVSTSTE